jgi:hypothetical protein
MRPGEDERPEVAHIFPYGMLNTPPPNTNWKASDMIPEFWRLLYLFWDEDRVDKWIRKIFPNAENPNTGVEPLFNLICLTPNAHDMWNKGAFHLIAACPSTPLILPVRNPGIAGSLLTMSIYIESKLRYSLRTSNLHINGIKSNGFLIAKKNVSTNSNDVD